MLRKEFIGLSLISFFSLLTKRVFGDTIDNHKMTTLKRFFSCEESATPNTYQGYFPFSFDAYYSPGWVCNAVDAAPTGFIELLDANGNLYGYTVIGAAAGVYNITIEAGNFGGSYTQYNLEFTLQSSCAAEQNIGCCATDNAVISWLGREGGIKQWNFPGVREYNIEVGDANTFKNSSYQTQYSQRKDIFTGKSVSTGNISREQVDFLDELRYSIQAWELVDGEWVSILLDNGSFFKYKTRDKLFDLTFRYVISEEIIMQTQ